MMNPIVFLIILCFNLFSFHPYYVSIVEIDQNAETKTLQMSVRIFTNDLEKALINEGKEDFFLGTGKENKDAQKWVHNYLNSHFEIYVNGELMPLNFVGKEYEADLTWLYFESDTVGTITSLEVKADFLMEIHDTQTNLVHTNVNGEKRSLILRKGREKERIEY